MNTSNVSIVAAFSSLRVTVKEKSAVTVASAMANDRYLSTPPFGWFAKNAAPFAIVEYCDGEMNLSVVVGAKSVSAKAISNPAAAPEGYSTEMVWA